MTSRGRRGGAARRSWQRRLFYREDCGGPSSPSQSSRRIRGPGSRSSRPASIAARTPTTTADASRSEWVLIVVQGPERQFGSLLLAAVVVIAPLLIGIGLWRRSKIAFFVAIALAALMVLPLPKPSIEQVAIYVIHAALAIVVLILLMRGRSWFFDSRGTEQPPSSPNAYG
jgi:hypothetical protein